MNEYLCVVLNAFLYTALLIVYRNKCRTFNSGTYIISIWVLCAVTGVLYEPVNWFGHMHQITLWPYIYLFVCNIMLFAPIMLYKEHLIESIRLNERLIYRGAIVLGIISILPFIESTVHYALNHNNSTMALERFSERYEDSSTTYYYLSEISKKLTYILHATRTFALFSLFYLPIMHKKPRNFKYVYVGVCISVIMIPLESLCLLARFQIVVYVMYGLFIFLSLKNLYPDVMLQKIIKYSKTLGIVFGFMIVFQTVSRYINYTDNLGNENIGLLAYIGQYLGESMGNFNGNIVHSEHYLGVEPILKTYLDLFGVDVQTAFYNENRFHTNQFFTGVGELWRAYGGEMAFALVCITSLLMYLFLKNTNPRNPSILTLFILYLFGKFSIIGIFYHAYFIDTYELLIIPLIGILLYKPRSKYRYR